MQKLFVSTSILIRVNKISESQILTMLNYLCQEIIGYVAKSSVIWKKLSDMTLYYIINWSWQALSDEIGLHCGITCYNLRMIYM